MIVPPESPAPVHTPVLSPVPSPSVSINTPSANQPSIHSQLETEPTHTPTERTEVITHEIDRLLHHIHELDRFRGQETQEISENVRIIRDELYDLSEYVRTRLVATEAFVAERPESPPVPRRDQSVGTITDLRDQSVGAITDHRDQSVGAMSVVSEPRPAPPGPRFQRPGLVPIALSPPPVRSPSINSTAYSISSFLSSHHSDDFSLLGTDEVEVVMAPPSPGWSSEPSSPSSDLTHSIVSSSESSPGPTLSLTSSSSSPTPPPSSPTPSTESTESSITARPFVPVEGITMTTIRDMLTQVREQTTALWEGQTSTNHMLDELRQARPAPQDNTEIFDRLHHIEALIRTLTDTRQDTARRDQRVAVEGTETVQISETIQRESRHGEEGSVTESEDSQADADSLLSRWRVLVQGRERGRPPLRMPAPRQAGPSLDEQLMELLNVPPAPVSSDIQPPPQLIPFIYQPAPRPSRSRSTSPVLRPESGPPFRQPSIWSPEVLHPPLQRPPRFRPPLTRPPRPLRTEEPASHDTPPVIPESIPGRTRTPRVHVSHDPPPGQVDPVQERTPVVRPPGPFLVCSLSRLLAICFDVDFSHLPCMMMITVALQAPRHT